MLLLIALAGGCGNRAVGSRGDDLAQERLRAVADGIEALDIGFFLLVGLDIAFCVAFYEVFDQICLRDHTYKEEDAIRLYAPCWLQSLHF